MSSYWWVLGLGFGFRLALGFGFRLALGLFMFVYSRRWWSSILDQAGQVCLLCSTLVFIGLWWSSLFMMVFVGLVCLCWSARMVQHVYDGVLWCFGLVWCGYGGVQWSRALVLGFFNTWPFKVFSAATSQTMFDFTDESFLLWSWWCSGCVALLSS